MKKFLIILLVAMIFCIQDETESPELKSKIDKTRDYMVKKIEKINGDIVPFIISNPYNELFRKLIRNIIEDNENLAITLCESEKEKPFCSTLISEIKKYYRIVKKKYFNNEIPSKDD